MMRLAASISRLLPTFLLLLVSLPSGEPSTSDHHNFRPHLELGIDLGTVSFDSFYDGTLVGRKCFYLPFYPPYLMLLSSRRIEPLSQGVVDDSDATFRQNRSAARRGSSHYRETIHRVPARQEQLSSRQGIFCPAEWLEWPSELA